MFKSEWKNIFKTRMLMASVLAVIIIPILYTGMFLWAFWDPYGSLSDLPVAVVNKDKGASYGGEELQLGKVLTDKLIEGENFKFTLLSNAEAIEAFNRHEYYMMIEIPDNFSVHATTLLDKNPSKLVIHYETNEGFNYLGSQIGNSAIERIRTAVNEQVSETYAEQLFKSITTMANGFTEATNGAVKIKNGASELAGGSQDLKKYLHQLSLGTVELVDGTNQLSDGSEQAANGAKQLQQGLTKLSEGSKQLQTGAQSAADGASQLQAGITQYIQGVSQLQQNNAKLLASQQQIADGMKTSATSMDTIATGTKNVATSANDLQEKINEFSQQLATATSTLPEQQVKDLQASLAAIQKTTVTLATGTTAIASNTNELAQGVKQLSTNEQQLVGYYQEAQNGLEKLTSQSNSLLDGSQQLASGTVNLSAKLGEFSTGVTSAEQGSMKLASSLNQLAQGSQTLQGGTQLLATKSNELSKGSTLLANGAQTLVDGTTTLASKLDDASGKADTVHPTDETYSMVSSPVEIEKKSVNEVPNYGTGFAPYFISLGLAVGALILSTVYPFVEPVIQPKNAASWFGSKVSVFAMIGLLQAIIVSLIVIFGLGIEVKNIAVFILIACVSSYTFIAMIQLLVSVLKDAGRFIGLLLLILQLTTSAGTFPIELIPAPLQGFYGMLPMTYTVNAFREVISIGDYDAIWHNLGILLSVMLGCGILTFIFFKMMFKHKYSKEVVQ